MSEKIRATDAEEPKPIAQRRVEFHQEEIRKYRRDALFAEELADKALVLVDGWEILQYAEEYPIVKYECNDESSMYLFPEPRLNSFVKSITVSTASSGIRVSVGTGKMEQEYTGDDTITYYEDKIGVLHAIQQADIHTMLLQKPQLIISPEGVLVFYTEKEILATIDCEHYYWINEWEIPVGKKAKIQNIITEEDDHLVVTVAEEIVDSESKVFTITHEREIKYNLKFRFDLTAHIPIKTLVYDERVIEPETLRKLI